MATKFMQKSLKNFTDFSSVQEIENFFLRIVGFWGQRLEVCYLNFQGSKGSSHDNQIKTKICQNCTYFNSVWIWRHFMYNMVFGIGEVK